MTFLATHPKSAREWSRLFITCLLIIALAILALPLSPGMPSNGLDPSWISAINEGVAAHRIFGRDIIFTFGPFGSVSTKAYHPATYSLMVWGSLIILLGTILGFWHLAKGSLSRFMAFPVAVALAGTGDSYLMTPPLLLLFCSAHVKIRRNVTLFDYITFISLAAACGLLPLIKGSLSGVVGVAGFMSALVLYFQKYHKLYIVTLGAAILSLTINWIISGQPILALPMFFVTQAPIISGYASAMSIMGPHWPVIVAILLSVCLWLLMSYWALGHDVKLFIPLSIGLAAYLFISLKAALVRHDGHAMMAATMFVYTGAVLFAAAPKGPAVLCATISIMGWTAIQYSVTGNIYEGINGASRKIRDSTSELLSLATKRDLRKQFELSNALVRKTSPFKPTGNVDVYPTELEPIFAYNANWSGRPIPQSYAAYTKDLLIKNAAFLLSNKAPQTIYFTVAPIDSRLPAQDDSLSWPILLSKYQISAMEGGYLELNRSPGGLYKYDYKKSFTVTKKDITNVPTRNTPLWASIDIQPSLLGKVVLAIYKLPDISIQLVLEDGTTVTHRIIPAIARQGFLLSPYVGSTYDFVLAAAGIADEKGVKSFQIVTRGSRLWKRQIKISLWSLHIPVQSKAIQIATTTPIANHYGDGQSTSDCAIDGVSVQRNRLIRIHGWATTNARSGISPDGIQISLSHASSTFFYDPPLLDRGDVGIAFGRPDMKMVGFDALLDAHMLDPDINLTIYAVKGSKRFKCPFTRIIN